MDKAITNCISMCVMDKIESWTDNCMRPELVEDHDKVDVIHQGKSLFVSVCDIA